MHNFKTWTQLDKVAEKKMRPNLGLKEWNDLTNEEKEKMWNYLTEYFEKKEAQLPIMFSILFLNENFKYHSYAPHFLEAQSIDNALKDFKYIFFQQHQDVIFELFSLYCKEKIRDRKAIPFSLKYKEENETEDEHDKRVTKWQFVEFDDFKERINDIFEHFGINVYLTRCGFVPKQDKKIIEEVYNPVLNFLSSKKWNVVNRELQDSFRDYQTKTEKGYSSSITHAIASLEAYLQVVLYNENGKGKLATLIKEAMKKEFIPSDHFSAKIFDNIESILAKLRAEVGDAHPKKNYANEKNARLVLNLVMIFLQHCVQN